MYCVSHMLFFLMYELHFSEKGCWKNVGKGAEWSEIGRKGGNRRHLSLTFLIIILIIVIIIILVIIIMIMTVGYQSNHFQKKKTQKLQFSVPTTWTTSGSSSFSSNLVLPRKNWNLKCVSPSNCRTSGRFQKWIGINFLFSFTNSNFTTSLVQKSASLPAFSVSINFHLKILFPPT